MTDTALADDEVSKVMGILSPHADKNFVRRILKRDLYPTLDLGNGTHATHRMASAEVDGKHVVYPTVIFDQEMRQLRQLDRDAAIDYAMQSGEFIEMPSADEADWLSRNYKKVWGEE